MMMVPQILTKATNMFESLAGNHLQNAKKMATLDQRESTEEKGCNNTLFTSV